MKKLYSLIPALSLFLLFFLFNTTLFSQYSLLQDKFVRSAIIAPPSYALEGYGELLAGLDLDEDGLPEIYAVNTNSVDRPGELIPKIYKFEFNGTSWDSVWATTLSTPQNTWPALTWGDLDKDGKKEIIWCPVNNLTDGTQGYVPNPARILIYESAGKGSDIMGVDDGFGGYLPNAKFTITTQDNFNLRPFKMIIHDIDNDGTDEMIFSDRVGNSTAMHFAVVSVDKVPDNGDFSETWTVEVSGLDPAMTLPSTKSKYDIVAIDNTIYLFDASGMIIPIQYSGGKYNVLKAQYPTQGSYVSDAASWKSAEVVDLNKDGKKEVVFGEWQGSSKVWLMEPGPDSMKFSVIADLTQTGTPGVKWLDGGAAGDVDGDGNVDFAYGSDPRHSTPVNSVYLVKYNGGAITDTNSYSVALIDSLGLYEGGQLDIIDIGNLDGDPEMEIAYSDGYTRSHALDSAMAIIVLDKKLTPVSVENTSKLVPENFYMHQNYPNPFNPATTIEFGISATSTVEVKVFNILGMEVATLISDTEMQPGSYKVSFDASRLASGNYFCRLKAGETVLTRKMTLIK
ncbi:MAG: T9SS type A sorting domain-containing protein [Bacteroidota bacterium]